LVFVLGGVTIAHVHAHAFLDHAQPAVGSEVKQTPHAVQIWFTEPIMAGSSSVKVFDALGKQVDKKDNRCDAANKSLLSVSLPSLDPGTYKACGVSGWPRYKW
jgi:methionine-rich copper-binding protein CopC